MGVIGRIPTIVGAIVSLILGILSFAGYWLGSDVVSLVSRLPGVGHTLAFLLYLIVWPWGQVMFPLLFLYLLIWNISLTQREAWTRLVGIAINVFSLLFLFGIFLVALPLLSIMGRYRWLFLGLWGALMLILIYESWWFLAPKTDAVFATRYKRYVPSKGEELPIVEIAPERKITEGKKKASGVERRRSTPEQKEPRRSLARFYDEDSGDVLYVYKSAVSIGRDPENDIVIEDSTVSGKHAILMYKGGAFTLRDLNSSNGTYVNDQKISETVISHGDVVRFGQATFKFQLPRRPAAAPRASDKKETKPAAWLIGEHAKYPLRQGKNTIGRGEDNTVVLEDPTVSRHHAVLYVERNGFTVQDLGSSNGTFVNGERLGAGRVRINSGDNVRFGNQSFTLTAAPIAERGAQGGRENDGISATEKKEKSGKVAKAFLISPEGQRFELGEGETTIGRSPANDIVIDNPTVSAYHAVVVFENGRFVLRDLESTNGTVVNGTKVKVHTLRSGEIIIFGNANFVFEHV